MSSTAVPDSAGPTATVPNVLAARYASAPMAELWSPEHKVVAERQLWIAVMRAQAELGVDIPADAIAAQQTDDLAFPHVETDAVQDVALAVIGVQVTDFEHRGVGHHSVRAPR